MTYSFLIATFLLVASVHAQAEQRYEADYTMSFRDTYSVDQKYNLNGQNRQVESELVMRTRNGETPLYMGTQTSPLPVKLRMEKSGDIIQLVDQNQNIYPAEISYDPEQHVLWLALSPSDAQRLADPELATAQKLIIENLEKRGRQHDGLNISADRYVCSMTETGLSCETRVHIIYNVIAP